MKLAARFHRSLSLLADVLDHDLLMKAGMRLVGGFGIGTAGLGVACAVALAGCVTPSIPIPPPDPSRMSFALTTTGPDPTATFTYPANVNYEDAVVFVYNRDRGTGIIQTAAANGSVGPTMPVTAAAGEQINVTFQIDDQSVSTCIRLREGAQDPTSYCDR